MNNSFNNLVSLSQYVNAINKVLTDMQYNDVSHHPCEIQHQLHEAYFLTATYFARPGRIKDINLNKLQASIQSIVHMVVLSYPRASFEVKSELCVYLTYMMLLDDGKGISTDAIDTFSEDLIHGSEQKHVLWRSVNDHLPDLLKHYGPFCSLSIFRSTLDFFQGCWIDQHNFQGYPGSHNYPDFLRRLNGLGQYIGASLFPKQDFDENKHFAEIITVIAEMEQWEIHVNDLLSFYKESFDVDEQANLIVNFAYCTGVSTQDSFSRLTTSIAASGKALTTILMNKAPKMQGVVTAFMQGYVTWHLTNPRYRIGELVEQVDKLRLDGNEQLCKVWKAAMDVGDVDPKLWATPSLQDMMEEIKCTETQLPLKLS
ncbi:hypothetical protein D6C78_10125 [Aureobasidium pullulans]|uniref:Trichodiene synthase n=1 Tax=Aureobasidium pullulans TaxID=5580 RepID=A0A4T0BE93_AURPU|nr:hypothetical protein D6C78_10125 [Aureobasidium pullulans]